MTEGHKFGIVRMSMVRALAVILLVAVLSTALLIHLIWHDAASRNVESAVAKLNAGAAASVNRELAQTFAAAEGAAEIIRSALFQGTIAPEDEAKREFLFLSVLRSQPALSWIGFAFPDGRFFGAHAAPDHIEMVEIGETIPGLAASLRRDLYDPVPGDIFFRERIRGTSEYIAAGSPWYRQAAGAESAKWTTVELLPSGFEPSAVVSTRIERFGKFLGVIMVSVSLDRVSDLLSGLEISKDGQAFVLDASGSVLAASADNGGAHPARLDAYPAGNGFARAVLERIDMPANETRGSVAVPSIGPAFITVSHLPFRDWLLATAIPRSYFTAEIDRANRFLPYAIGGLAMLAAFTSALFARMLFARPLRRLARQLKKIEEFRLDDVRHEGTFLAELDDLSSALKKMSTGLSSFGRYIPVDVVRELVGSGAEPRPGGEVHTITVMFADLPGFTEMSEKLGPDIEPYLTRFLTIAVDAVHREGGTVDKFIGDEVMAIWNAPGEVDGHAERACRAALAISEALQEIPLPLPGPGAYAAGPRVRIGINSGYAIVGNVGSSTRLSYTAIGDTVNLASRLVGVAKEHGVEIVVSSATLNECSKDLHAFALGTARVRGRAEAVSIFTIDAAQVHVMPAPAGMA